MPAIHVENLGKQYRIIGTHRGKQSVREALAGAVAAPLRRLFGSGLSRRETLWALRDLHFEVQRGEAVGIVGRNGAGKSTLLRILSRITRPTTGRALLRGRVTSLLEVGTGFHPDLSGRENIFLNGAVLGMSRAQIRSKFDAIVAFAEIEKFLDEPVKHYSSGMYVRLAFAVAAHLEPDILILDEVLSVGDAAFQQKCQTRIEEILRNGCTLLLVSHNLHAVATLCSRALYLHEGVLRSDGPPRDVIGQYLAQTAPRHDDAGECRWTGLDEAPGNESIRLHAVRIVSGERATGRVDVQSPVRIEVEYQNLLPDARIDTLIQLSEESGVGVLSSANLPSFNSDTDAWHDIPRPPGIYRSSCTLPAHLLNEHRYFVSVFIVANKAQVAVASHNVIAFQAYDGDPLRHRVVGVVRPRLAWQTERLR
jgi:lipopolysaccharide transport system ATP-binding protein